MNGQQLAPMTVGFAIAVVLILVIGFFRRKRNMIAHLAPVKRELKKEKQWLRRGEYNAAMVKGRQNLELFLKLWQSLTGSSLIIPPRRWRMPGAVQMEEDSARLTG